MNKQNKKTSVTIGVPAYNEERNLPQLLDSLKNIKFTNSFKLEKVILISDGSNDRTSEIINNFRLNNIKVVKIISKSRRGKVYRLNQLFALSKTKYLVVLDADILLGKSAIENLIISAAAHQSFLTVSHQISIGTNTIIGRAIDRGHKIWAEIRTSKDKYLDNYQNFYGASTVYDYKFYHSLRIPPKFHDERKFIYYSAKKNGSFVYEKKSIIYYRSVATFRELYITGSRGDGIDQKIEKLFSKDILEQNEIPFQFKLKILIKHLFIDPFGTILYLVLKYQIMFTRRVDPLVSDGTWTIVSSTKSGFAEHKHDI